MKADPFHTPGLLVHVACLAQLKMRNDLFGLAHRLTEAMPTQAIAWFAVGVYYLVIGDSEKSRAQFRCAGCTASRMSTRMTARANTQCL